MRRLKPNKKRHATDYTAHQIEVRLRNQLCPAMDAQEDEVKRHASGAPRGARPMSQMAFWIPWLYKKSEAAPAELMVLFARGATSYSDLTDLAGKWGARLFKALFADPMGGEYPRTATPADFDTASGFQLQPLAISLKTFFEIWNTVSKKLPAYVGKTDNPQLFFAAIRDSEGIIKLLVKPDAADILEAGRRLA